MIVIRRRLTMITIMILMGIIIDTPVITLIIVITISVDTLVAAVIIVVTISVNYDRKLDPAWYFQPLQEYGVTKMAEFLIEELMAKGDS